ncbi:sigma-70 family RNA polymerase sigma factor [Streptomyces scabiei]|uniref:sigma-70 family RNA polymerase sigma factor n=3 Tax=Streptomyces scabiei TaxID=1930 RepID=UPI001B318561|nr:MULTISPECIES: sigma-70 family RNA polymerase sigma factor [unclassified Streptomyces]MBP5870651.1 sigma-70 family RNA polymerase sigma factor [Streptomyces sp. LBUM 1485]MBP5913460.1 sigma-70 family RNA polymerase sigma factor [Streptomyces sp. LBUM 1486]QTU57142.1 sigma-70 family RNA polymerase sigma factor [Streptomyces sp. LBUM 1480]
MRSQDARERTDVAVVMAARAGDRQAAERLVRDCLPLVYNIVGRALNGHGDVDDVVQETMMRVLDGLPGLERPDRFRSWLVAITVRQIRDRWRKGRPWLTAEPLEATTHEADPQADFTDLVVLRLALSGQRREAVEATRWLEDEEREVLALWWMESAGELTRGELSAACGLAPQHAAVRVQRVKERLETARTVVRAVTASPRCTDLAAALAPWDGQPSGLWRKRLARHVRDCPHCLSNSSDLIPAERLLAGLALAPVPVGLAGLVLARMPGAETAGAAAGAGTHTAGTHTAGTHTAGGAISAAGGAKGAAWTIGTTAAKPAATAVAVSAAAVVTLAAAGAAWYTFTGAHEPAPRPAVAAPPSPAPSSAPPSPQTSAPGKPTPSPTQQRKRKQTPSAAPTVTAGAPLSGRHSLRSVDDHGDYVSGSGRFGALSPVNAASSAATRRAATFTFVPGLADPRCYSLRDAAGRYLRHYAFRVRLDADDGSALFRKDVTFCPRPGSTAGSVSLESYNYPGRYLRHRDDLQLWLDRSQNTAAYRASRSFVLVAPWA